MLLFRQKPKQRNNSKNVQGGLGSDAEKRELSDSLGPLTETFSSPLPAPLVKTLKSATSFTLTPFGWRPLPVALQAFGFTAERNNNKCERKIFSKAKATESSQQLAAMLVAKTLKYPIHVGFDTWLTEPVNENDAHITQEQNVEWDIDRTIESIKRASDNISVTAKCWLQA